MNKVTTISQRTGVSTFASPTSPSTDQSLQKSFHLSHSEKIELKKISSHSGNKKYANAQPNSTKTITAKHNRYNGLQTQTTEHQQPTKCICHKGFSGYSGIVTRSNFRVGGQETAPQSLTAHTLDRYGQPKTIQ